MVADALQRIAGKRRNAGEHFVEHHTQREQIGTRVLRAADDLFRTPVSGRAEKRSITRVVAGRDAPCQSQ